MMMKCHAPFAGTSSKYMIVRGAQAIMSSRPKLCYEYFKQLFAQVRSNTTVLQHRMNAR